MNVQLKTVPKEQVRCDGYGDWFYGEFGILATCADIKEWDDDTKFRIAVHEMVEAWLCRKHGVTDTQVCKFDLLYEAERAEEKHGELDEPGDDPRAPYREEHRAADHVERALCQVLGLTWDLPNQA